MLRFYVCALVCTLSGCTDDTNKGDAGADLAALSDGGEDGGDLAVGDGSSGDLSTGPDLDNHVLMKPLVDAVPISTSGAFDYYELHVKQALVQVLPGPMTAIWGFNGLWPGPTIHATLGRPIRIRVFNELPVAENLSIHNHGHNVPSAFDGHPSNHLISPPPAVVNYYDYDYPNMQHGGVDPNIHGASTYFFHDHVVDQTAPHFYKGIVAFYIIHPKPGSDEANLNLPSGAQDVPLMIQDKTFKADNSLDYNVSVINGFQGEMLMVNGTPHPYMNVARRKYRFRLLNGSNARRIDVGLKPGSFYQIGTDGGLLPVRLNPSKIPLAPAERADIVIDFAQYKIGDIVTLTNDDTFDPVQPEILQFRVNRDETDTSSLPSTALDPTFVRYTDGAPANTRAPSTRMLVFDLNAATMEWRINSKKYNVAAYEFADSKIGDVETWTLTNSSTIPHPFHQHLIEFQILDICPNTNTSCGVGPPGTQAGWKDTVLVPANSTVRIKMQFYYNGPMPTPSPSPFPGDYVFHCHNLEHEDHAMMLQQQVNYP